MIIYLINVLNCGLQVCLAANESAARRLEFAGGDERGRDERGLAALEWGAAGAVGVGGE